MGKGVYVKGMEMPESCEKCDFNMGLYCKRQCDDETYLIRFESNLNKLANCPLVEVPEHGDLIDRNALLMDAGDVCESFGDYAEFGFSRDQIKAAPTIIPADKEDT